MSRKALSLDGMWIPSLRNRFLVLCVGLAFVALGLLPLPSFNIDAFPDTTPVQVQINTIAHGLAPEEVEKQVTAPVARILSSDSSLYQARFLLFNMVGSSGEKLTSHPHGQPE